MNYNKQTFFEALVPETEKGKEVSLIESIQMKDLATADQKFSNAVQILLHPNQWNDVAGGAKFDVRHGKGSAIKENDFIRINIPGPGPVNGDGYDWVVVERVIDERNNNDFRAVGLKLKASADPDSADNATAHFFEHGASSTIIVSLQSNEITAQYFGRNEKPNVETGSIITNIRNTLVASGAMLGLSELQWSSLLKGLLKQ